MHFQRGAEACYLCIPRGSVDEYGQMEKFIPGRTSGGREPRVKSTIPE